MLWLAAGNNNTKFFHNFANHMKNYNTIWEIIDDEGNMFSSFVDKVEVGAKHFENLFKSPSGCLIHDILEVLNKFSRVFMDDMNNSLEEVISEEELQVAMFSMQSGKSPGLNGFPVEFYKTF
jgi:hypothetical protein